MESIFAIHAFGSTKEEHQKVVIPEITVFISINLPENDSVLVDQELNHCLFLFVCGDKTSETHRCTFLFDV